jgi:hypothetical protein
MVIYFENVTFIHAKLGFGRLPQGTYKTAKNLATLYKS